jgi:membrane protein
MLAKFHALRHWLSHDLWRLRLEEYSAFKAFALRRLRICVLTLRTFSANLAALQASALTYFTLLSLVPVLAVFFGIAKGFNLDERAEAELMRYTRGQEETIRQIIDWARDLIDKAPGGLIAGLGTALLLVAVIKLLTRVEHTFNHIYGVRRNRPLARKFADYLATIVIAPVFLAAAGAATVAITTSVETFFQNAPETLQTFRPYVAFLLQLIPFALVWLLFTFLYISLPYTHVKISSALTAGFLAGALFQIVQWAYFTFQIGVARYSAIYGSLAALPLFLVWVQWSWMVTLLGICLAYAHQHVDEYRYEPDCENMSHAHRRRQILLVAH